MRNLMTWWLVGLLGCGIVGGPLSADQPAAEDAPLVEAGAGTVTYGEAQEELQRIAAEREPSKGPTEAEVKVTIARFAKEKLMTSDAEQMGLDRRPEVAFRLERARQAILREVLLNEKAGTMDQADLEALAKDYYDTHKGKFRPEKAVHASHILFASKCQDKSEACMAEREGQEAKAKEMVAKLAEGGRFEDLARQYSEDRNSADLDGLIPMALTQRKSDPEFWKVAWELEPGQVSGVVRSRFGYHVIRLESKQDDAIPSYEEVREPLMEKLATQQAWHKRAQIESEYQRKITDSKWNPELLLRLTGQMSPEHDAGAEKEAARVRPR